MLSHRTRARGAAPPSLRSNACRRAAAGLLVGPGHRGPVQPDRSMTAVAYAVVRDTPPTVYAADSVDVLQRLLALEVVARTPPAFNSDDA